MNKRAMLVGLVGLFACMILVLMVRTVPSNLVPAPTATPGDLQAQVLIQSAHDDRDPVWSPDGSQIAFVGHDAGNPDIFVYKMADRSITNDSNYSGDDFNPVWSPDSSTLAYLGRKPHYIDLFQDYLVTKSLTTGVTKDISDKTGYTRFLGWTADSSAFIYWQDYTIYRYDMSQQSSHVLYTFRDLPTLSLSPDGQWLMISEYANHDEFVMDSRTGDRYALPQGTLLSPSWSPDSQRLAFIVEQYPYQVSLYIWQAASKTLQQIVKPSKNLQVEYDTVVWSPDGRLAWVSNPSESTPGDTISTFDTKTNQRRDVVAINQYVPMILWSPTRDQIAFKTFAGVYVVDVPSSVYRDFIQGIAPVQTISWSPDGDYVEASLGYPWTCEGQLGFIDVRSGSTYLYRDNAADRFPHYVCGIQWRPHSHTFIFNGGNDTAINVMMISLPG